MSIKNLFSRKRRRAARRAAHEAAHAAAQQQMWQPGKVHKHGDTTTAHRERLLQEILKSAPDADQALEMILGAIGEMPDLEEQEHTLDHQVRLLQTYALVPPGPGTIVDVAASAIYEVPLRKLKQWQVNPIEILEIDYERDPLPFEDASQDGVMLCEVMEHFVIDPMFCFNEINRILKKDGFFVVTTPNVASWFSIYQALRNMHPSRWPVYAGAGHKEANHIHSREYMVSELTTLLEAAGFEVEEILTRDYGIAAEYEPIPGFDQHNRGETIFCRARKVSPPQMRYTKPVYLENQPFMAPGLSAPPVTDTTGPAQTPPNPPLSNREAQILKDLKGGDASQD